MNEIKIFYIYGYYKEKNDWHRYSYLSRIFNWFDKEIVTGKEKMFNHIWRPWYYTYTQRGECWQLIPRIYGMYC